MAKTAAKTRKKRTVKKKGTDSDVKEKVEDVAADAEAPADNNGGAAVETPPAEEESTHAKYERIKRGNL
ncbi:MAG: hypothetical protein ACYSOZ_00475, partial [Planctomycetota bacterium]